MARVTYQDEFITEYDDGTEEVRFTAEEWAVMLSDPKFGYVCHMGHRLPANHHLGDGTCWECEGEAEAAYADYLDSLEDAEPAEAAIDDPTPATDDEPF